MSVSIGVLDTPPALLGECPVWDPDNEALWWTDIEGRVVHRRGHDTGEVATFQFPGRVGSFALGTTPETLVAACETELLLYDCVTGTSRAALTLEPSGEGIRLNDGKADPAGRFLVGSMYEDTKAGKAVGRLHQVGNDVGSRVLEYDVGVSNGLGFDPERGRMFWADTPTRTITLFDYDVATGAVSEKRTFFDYGDLPGKPDGGCVDADGGYWSACVHAGAVIRLSPDGVVDERIELPVKHPTMMCFGGPNLDTMFVTSIADDDHDGPDGAVLFIEGLDVTGRIEARVELLV